MKAIIVEILMCRIPLSYVVALTFCLLMWVWERHNALEIQRGSTRVLVEFVDHLDSTHTTFADYSSPTYWQRSARWVFIDDDSLRACVERWRRDHE